MKTNYVNPTPAQIKRAKTEARIEATQRNWKKLCKFSIIILALFIVAVILNIFFDKDIIGKIAVAMFALAMLPAIIMQVLVTAGRAHYIDYTLDEMSNAVIFMFVLFFAPGADAIFFIALNDLFSIIPGESLRGIERIAYLHDLRIGILILYVSLIVISFILSFFLAKNTSREN